MYILNMQAIKVAARKMGFGGVKPLLEHLGFHRNALDRFSRGAGVLPESIERVLAALNLPIQEGLIQQQETLGVAEEIMPLVEEMHKKHPNISFFLFGSRAKGRARKYSDFDLGVYAKEGVPLAEFLQILEEKEAFEDVAPQRIDCVNLNNATSDFLRDIAPDLRLLAGYDRDTVAIKRVFKGDATLLRGAQS
jgi:predicted nucleotidyltransferase